MATELKFDTRAINDAIPIKEALRQYAGVDVDAQKGKKIRCISKDHPDNSPSMDVYEKSSHGGNNCFCHSCHASFTPIGVALEYSNRDFRSTVEQMLNDFGLDVYQYSNKAEVERERGYKRSGKKEEIFPLNAEDLELIGLKYANGGSVKQQINIDENGKGERFPRSVIKMSNDNHKSLHPTQKPVLLCEYLIKTYTNEGMTVLDNCMGVGTTGIACCNLNRNYIGIELNNEYFSIAKERIEAIIEKSDKNGNEICYA